MGAIADYALFGWRVRSALHVPELLPWSGSDCAPDIVIAFGEVPALEGAVRTHGPVVQLGERCVRLAIANVAAYRIDDGRRVTIEPWAAPASPDIRTFLLGTVLAILCYQNGLLPLHAATVEIDGFAVLIAGRSGSGKSTLAGALQRRGCRLLSDDLCALEVGPDGTLRVRPPFPRLRLSAESMAALGIATDGIERSAMQRQKYHPPVGRFLPDPLPLRYVALMRPTRDMSEAGVRTLEPFEVVRRLDLVHRGRLAQAMGYHSFLFSRMAALAKSTLVVELSRMEDWALLDHLAGTVIEVARRATA